MKIAIDPDFSSVNFTPTIASIEELENLPKPGRTRLPNKQRINETEKSTFRVEGTVARVKIESDSDLHILLVAGSNHVVAEIPSPACALNSPLANKFADARKVAIGLRPNQILRITGIGFFDRIHGQRGEAKNGFELHPAYLLEVLK